MPPPDGLKLKNIKILYEDKYYIVFDKPPGLLVVPTPKKEKNTLENIVNEACLAAGRQERLYPCHRLDRDTSGIIIFAKGRENQERMMQEFKNRKVAKEYIALVRGRLSNRQGEIKSSIRDFEQKKFQGNSPAKLAITRYSLVEQRKLFGIVKVHPLTGRTNQVRIHFSEIGHPLLGERKYAFAKDFPLKFRRAALHASELKWWHPVYCKTVKIVSPLPDDMAAFVAAHKNYSPPH